jgi:hypothetical protein
VGEPILFDRFGPGGDHTTCTGVWTTKVPSDRDNYLHMSNSDSGCNGCKDIRVVEWNSIHIGRTWKEAKEQSVRDIDYPIILIFRINRLTGSGTNSPHVLLFLRTSGLSRDDDTTCRAGRKGHSRCTTRMPCDCFGLLEHHCMPFLTFDHHWCWTVRRSVCYDMTVLPRWSRHGIQTPPREAAVGTATDKNVVSKSCFAFRRWS